MDLYLAANYYQPRRAEPLLDLLIAPAHAVFAKFISIVANKFSSMREWDHSGRNRFASAFLNTDVMLTRALIARPDEP